MDASLPSIPARPSASVAPRSSRFQVPSSDRTSSVTGTPPAGFPRDVSSTCVVSMLMGRVDCRQSTVDSWIRPGDPSDPSERTQPFFQPQACDLYLLFGGHSQLLGGSIMEAATAEVEHFLGGPARGAHDEDITEALLVLAVVAGESRKCLRRSPARAGLLGGRLSGSPRADSRMRGESLEPVLFGKLRPDPVGIREELFLAGE